MIEVCIALGSNLGAREEFLQQAVIQLKSIIEISAVSAWHETLPIGGPLGQGRYLNGALRGMTNLSAHALLKCCLTIEENLGRKRNDETEKWSARTIDLDLIFYGDKIIAETAELIVPHPRMHERVFVLRPLCEIAPNFMHPVLNKTVDKLLSNISFDGNRR